MSLDGSIGKARASGGDAEGGRRAGERGRTRGAGSAGTRCECRPRPRASACAPTATDAGGLTGNTGTASILVANPPSIVKAFGASTVALNANVSLTFSLSNTNATTTLNGIAFTDSLPAGMVVATPSNLNSTCNGSAVAVNGASSASLSGASLAPGGSCSISLNVLGTTAGIKSNTVSVTSTTTAALSNSSTTSVTVVAPPTVTKGFSVGTIPLNGSATLNLTVANPNGSTALTGVGFTDSLPSGLVVSTPNGQTGTCVGTISAVAGSNLVSLSGETLAANGSCTLNVNVTGVAAGTQINTTGAPTSTEGGTGVASNSATIKVLAPPSIVKSFGAASISVGGTTSLSFTITNPSTNTAALAGLAFTDSLPSGLVVATPNGLSNPSCGGVATAVPGSTSVSLSGGSISTPGNNCTVSVNVTSVSGGIKNNSVSISSSNGGTGNTSNASVTVTSAVFSINNASAVKPATGTSTILFTVSLASPATSTVGVQYATADGTAQAGTDYTSTTGTLTFNAGDQLQTIPVTLTPSGSATSRTFTVNLSNPTGGAIISAGTGTGTINVTKTPSIALISELRSSGPGGLGDDFVEIYNNADTPRTVGGTGWAVVKAGASCAAAPQIIAVIPNGTVIPARGHYLLVGSQYGLSGYPAGTGSATGDQTLLSDIESDANIGLFSASTIGALSSANRLDAVGFGSNTGGNCDLLRKGGTLAPALGDTVNQYSYVRKMTSGLPQDTDDNASDLIMVSTSAPAQVGSYSSPVLGAPGPENLSSPRMFGGLTTDLLDPNVAQTLSPNRVRSTASYNDTLSGTGTYGLGTLAIRRTYINNTGAAVTRLRFRIVDVTTAPASAGVADLRAISSPASQLVGTSNGNVTVTGTVLETPPAQAIGGGINSTMTVTTVTLGTPLNNGQSISVQWLLGAKQGGTFRFMVNIEALP